MNPHDIVELATRRIAKRLPLPAPATAHTFAMLADEIVAVSAMNAVEAQRELAERRGG